MAQRRLRRLFDPEHEMGLEELRYKMKVRVAYEELLLGGCEGNGLYLSPFECMKLLHVVRDGIRRKPGRPRSPESMAEVRDTLAAEYSFILEADGLSTEAAIAQAAENYDVSRSKMFKCRANWLTGSESAEYLERLKNDPEVRRRTRQALEENVGLLFK